MDKRWPSIQVGPLKNIKNKQQQQQKQNKTKNNAKHHTSRSSKVKPTESSMPSEKCLKYISGVDIYSNNWKKVCKHFEHDQWRGAGERGRGSMKQSVNIIIHNWNLFS